MGFIKARGNNFYYEEKGEGPPILLIPPSGSTASTWGTLVGDLAGAGRVIAYDRRGYSRSGGEVVRSAAEHARGCRGSPGRIGGWPAVAVGTSAGATIALDLAVRLPDLVRAVVVHEAAWRALRHPDASGLGTLARMQWLAWRGRYPEAAEVLLRWVYGYRDGGSAWDAFPEAWRRTARENGRSVVADLRATMGGYPRPQDLARITAPVVCTYGSRSRSYMRSVTRSLAQAIPTASVREIDGAAHAVPFDAPGNFAQGALPGMAGLPVRHRPGASRPAGPTCWPGWVAGFRVLPRQGVTRVAGLDGPGDAGGWRVFISHTSELRDFPEGTSYVAAVERAISAAGHVIVDMADFPAADQAPARLCAERVRGCDVYVGVLGTRYGSPVRDMPEVSYTELEFDTATEAGLDRLVFLLDTDAADVGIPLSTLIDREFGARQDAFRRRVQDSGLVTQSFASPAALGQLVERSLRDLAETRRGAGGGGRGGQGPVVVGDVPQEPAGFQPRADLLAELDAPGGRGGGCGWCAR